MSARQFILNYSSYNFLFQELGKAVINEFRHSAQFTVGCVFAILLLFSGPALVNIVLPTADVSSAYAQKKKKGKEETPSIADQTETRRVPAMRERTYKKLSEAQELLENKQYQEALRLLNNLKGKGDLNEYEVAMTWNIVAYVYISQEKYKQAITAYREILKLVNIPETLEQQILISAAQLHLATEQPREAIKLIQRLHKVAKPTTDSYAFYGQACFQIEDYKCSITQMDNAVNLAFAQDGKPKEMWLLIMRYGYYELNNIPKMIEVLELLVKLYPKGDYFFQLAIAYGEAKDDAKQLSVLEASYDGGYFTKSQEYVTLAQLLLSVDVPYKAAKILVEGFDKEIVDQTESYLKLLSQCWLLAQEPEKAVIVLKRAAKKSEDGETFVRLGRSYQSMDDWTGCITSIRAGLKKGDVKRPDSARLNLGMCLFNADRLNDAIKAFDQARKDKRSRKIADNWIEYLRNEKKRRQKIEEFLQ